MKKILLIIGSCLLFTAMDCTKDTKYKHYRIFFYNESAYTIYIDGSSDYPDTSLRNVQNVMHPGWNLDVESHNYNDQALLRLTTWESLFIKMDTLIVFVFNSDTLLSRGWDYVKDHNIVAQRYDLSLSNLQNLDWKITFPPTEEMQNIKMWPPYGTYDSLGYRIN